MTRRPGLPDYDAIDVPPLVAAAVARARESGAALACTPETGRLLMMLTASRPIARAGELGTGYGVGAAWIASGLRPGGSLVTVEIDPERAAIAREAFAGHSEIEVITGDWACAKQHGPFDILFSDGGPKRKPGDPELLAPLLRPGGILLLDDYTPEGAWTTEQRALFADDVSRRIWLQNPRWIACELQTAPDMAVIVAVYIGDWGSTSHESSQQASHSQTP